MLNKIGYVGESICLSYLKNKGYKLIKRNWHCKYSEFDLVMCDQNETVFVEVKTMNAESFSVPERMFNRSKINKLIRAIDIYKQLHEIPDFRLDLVTVVYGKELKIRHYKNILALNPLKSARYI